MKPIKTFTIGSRAFFECYPDFESKDIDELCIMDEFNLKGNSIHARGLHGKDVFFFRDMSKQRWLDDIKQTGLPMCVGKFLVPEFCEYIGVTVGDLEQLRPIIEKIDKKHEYEKVIFDAYIENGSFTLTPEQRRAAYDKYLENK